MVKALMLVVVATISTLYAAIAFAQAVAVPEDPDGLLRGIVEAVQGGNWRVAVVLGVVLVVYALRRWGSRLVPWFATDRGGAVLALATALVATLAPALISGPLSAKVLLDALLLGFTSAGAWAATKKILGV